MAMAEEKAAEEKPDYSDTEDEDEDEGDFKDMEEFIPKMKPKARKCSVMAAAVTVAADWTPPVYEKTGDEALMLTNRVSSNTLMKHLSPKEIDILVKAFQVKGFEAGEVIIQQGAEGDLFYIIEQGLCDITIEGVGKVMEIDGGQGRDFFGELALLYNAPRAATVTAQTVVKSWTLDRDTFKTIMQDSATKKGDLNKKFLDQVPLLSALSPMEKTIIADSLKSREYTAGDLILTQGAAGDDFFIIEEGSVVCTKSGAGGAEEKVSDELGPGSYFGELALLNDDVRQANVKALENTTCLCIDRGTFKRVVGPLQAILKQNEEMYAKYVASASED